MLVARTQRTVLGNPIANKQELEALHLLVTLGVQFSASLDSQDGQSTANFGNTVTYKNIIKTKILCPKKIRRLPSPGPWSVGRQDCAR
jgi:hypothetical protein